MNILYDYYYDGSFVSVFFSILTVVCLFALICLIKYSVKNIKKYGFNLPNILWMCAVAVVLTVTVSCSFNAYRLFKFDIMYSNHRYETVAGTLRIIEIERDDYRDAEQYDVIFTVDDVLFDNTNSFTKEQKDQLVERDNKTIMVHYNYVGKKPMIYEIIE